MTGWARGPTARGRPTESLGHIPGHILLGMAVGPGRQGPGAGTHGCGPVGLVPVLESVAELSEPFESVPDGLGLPGELVACYRLHPDGEQAPLGGRVLLDEGGELLPAPGGLELGLGEDGYEQRGVVQLACNGGGDRLVATQPFIIQPDAIASEMRPRARPKCLRKRSWKVSTQPLRLAPPPWSASPEASKGRLSDQV